MLQPPCNRSTSPRAKSAGQSLTCRILGVDYEYKGQSFWEIHTSLAKKTGKPKITVPTVETGDEFITESWDIAQWVSLHYIPGSNR